MLREKGRGRKVRTSLPLPFSLKLPHPLSPLTGIEERNGKADYG